MSEKIVSERIKRELERLDEALDDVEASPEQIASTMSRLAVTPAAWAVEVRARAAAVTASARLVDKNEFVGLPKRIAIVGSRDFKSRRLVEEVVNSLPAGTTVISGGATGPDTWAERAARDRGLEVITFIPDWAEGRRAGPLRNQKIVDAAEMLIAFWDEKSRGTADSINKAKIKGIETWTYIL